MAINLNCNLNGGDSVTPNNELFYRIYGDVDNYSSPIHTTGTAIADADVTVTGDVVDILNVDEATNTSFKIAAVDESGNEGILSDAYSGSIILFRDDFTGSTLNPAPAKWTLANEVPANIIFAQNDTLQVQTTGSTSSSSASNYYRSIDTFDMSTTKVISFDISSTNQDANGGWGIGLQNGIIDRVLISAEAEGSGSGNIRAIINENSVLLALESIAFDISSLTSIKIVSDGANVTYYSWVTDAWVQFYTVACTFGAVSLPINISQGIAAADNLTQIYDNLYVCSADFDTQYPV